MWSLYIKTQGNSSDPEQRLKNATNKKTQIEENPERSIIETFF